MKPIHWLLLSLLLMPLAVAKLASDDLRAQYPAGYGWLADELEPYANQSLVVVNFWASWCAPCRHELPMLNRIHQQGVAVLGFSMDEDRFLAEEFLRQLPVGFPNVLGQAADATAVDVFPTTIITDASGKVFFLRRGEVTESEITEALARINAKQGATEP